MLKKLFILCIVLAIAAGTGFSFWAKQPIITSGTPIEFSVAPGSGVAAAARQIAAAGVPINPTLLSVLARVTQQASKVKAGSYLLKPGTTPRELISQMVRGQFAQETLTIIEGWTFKQMRAAIAASAASGALRHDTASLSDAELIALVTPEFKQPEGLFFPDTYLFAKGSSDLQVYRQAHAMLKRHLAAAWEQRDPSVPYTTPYQALVMASIVEKETGRESERAQIAGVFVNRLKAGMLLQTDPSVIYGMGDAFKGNIRKRDLERDTPYNTYTRVGLPPTPIALPGARSLEAALQPANTSALYFVSRGDGTSAFSDSLAEHNRAVNKYQR